MNHDDIIEIAESKHRFDPEGFSVGAVKKILVSVLKLMNSRDIERLYSVIVADLDDVEPSDDTSLINEGLILTWQSIESAHPQVEGWYAVKRTDSASPSLVRWYGSLEAGRWNKVTHWLGPIPSPPLHTR